MPRRGEPERIYQAQRAGIFRRLVDAERLNAFDAEQWIEAWEREAERQGLDRFSAAFWSTGREWIAENRGKH